MRLINASTFQLENFPDDRIPKYAILSHRWEDDEASFQDMQTSLPEDKAGFVKIRETCLQAIADELNYIWVDTCCIDKTSSAEISQAINSMFEFYRKADVCYAYLSDVSNTAQDVEKAISQSVWFTRGWTLQELIAPAHVAFFNKDWVEIGNKRSLEKLISSVTRIDPAFLRGEDLTRCSIAQRMSWASKRQTSRVEDIAYSLMGLFDVNMPMIYGEGSKAFLRLQEEIIKHSDDQSIFAWSSPAEKSDRKLLASSPACFIDCQDINKVDPLSDPAPFALNNMGLEIKLTMIPWAMDTYLGVLACRNGQSANRIGIFLEPLPQPKTYGKKMLDGNAIEHVKWDTITRIWNDQLIQKLQSERILIRYNVLTPVSSRFYGLRLGDCRLFNEQFDAKTHLYTLSLWDEEKRTLQMPKGYFGTVCAIAFPFDGSTKVFNLPSLVLKLGFDGSFEPAFSISTKLVRRSIWPSPASDVSRAVKLQLLEPSWITDSQGWKSNPTNDGDCLTCTKFFDKSEKSLEWKVRLNGHDSRDMVMPSVGIKITFGQEELGPHKIWTLRLLSMSEEKSKLEDGSWRYLFKSGRTRD